MRVPDAIRSTRSAPSPSGGAVPPAGDATSFRAVPSSTGARERVGEAAAASPSLPGADPAAADNEAPPSLCIDAFDQSQRRALRLYADHHRLTVTGMLRAWESDQAELLEKIGFRRGRPYEAERGLPW